MPSVGSAIINTIPPSLSQTICEQPCPFRNPVSFAFLFHFPLPFFPHFSFVNYILTASLFFIRWNFFHPFRRQFPIKHVPRQKFSPAACPEGKSAPQRDSPEAFPFRRSAFLRGFALHFSRAAHDRLAILPLMRVRILTRSVLL